MAILGFGRYTPASPAPDEDALTMMLAAARRVVTADGSRPNRLALASTSLPYLTRVQAGMAAMALGLPKGSFCLECTTSARSGTEAMLALGTGLVLAADGNYAAAVLLGAAGGLGEVAAASSAVGEYPGLEFMLRGEGQRRDVAVPDYTEAAYLDLITTAARGLGAAAGSANILALNPPEPRLGPLGAKALGYPQAVTAPPGAGAAGPIWALAAALDQAAPGQFVLLVSYGAGSAADALLVRKREG